MTFCSAPNTEERGHRSPSISVHDKCNAFSLLPANNNNAQYHLRSWDEQIKCSHQRHGTNGRCLAVASDARAKARQQLLPPPMGGDRETRHDNLNHEEKEFLLFGWAAALPPCCMTQPMPSANMTMTMTTSSQRQLSYYYHMLPSLLSFTAQQCHHPIHNHPPTSILSTSTTSILAAKTTFERSQQIPLLCCLLTSKEYT
eukprot:CAMPEP_0172299788 /NCGR_PEP_ID=MMETSP1058-20130122/2008_1 /TAXON_ID=83371 /ORGANISM="Detonula confervacea, Strain CCMP 353" /LENGTH=199 /DNA_ID=CAMNT_0013009351 /DNA_START=602 /DNA_END=1197 /DNA_ORIENTATION=+